MWCLLGKCFERIAGLDRADFLKKIKVVKHKKNSEQHVQDHSDQNDEVEKLGIPVWPARLGFDRLIHD
jgi:hypothetical protein